LQGYERVVQRINLDEGQNRSLNVVLRRPPGELVVTVNPLSASVRLLNESGTQIQSWTGNRRIDVLPAGRYTLDVSANGFAPHREVVDVVAGNVVRKAITLQANQTQRL
jgi:hypothetical protein